MKNDRLIKYADRLWVFAWRMEYLVVALGLLIAGTIVAENLSAHDTWSVQVITSSIIGAIPFVAVAAAELCKLPLSVAIISTRNFLWRVFLIIVMVCITFITFETMLAGLERNFTDRVHRVAVLEAELAQVRSHIVTADTVEDNTRDKVVELQALIDKELPRLTVLLEEESSAEQAYIKQSSYRNADGSRGCESEYCQSLEKIYYNKRDRRVALEDIINSYYARIQSVRGSEDTSIDLSMVNTSIQEEAELLSKIQYEKMNSQIHRFAIALQSYHPMEESRALEIVKTAWFGSLAFFVAITGSVLGFASQILHIEATKPKKASGLRSLAAAILWRKRWYTVPVKEYIYTSDKSLDGKKVN